MRVGKRHERARIGPTADRHAAELARKLGAALRDARRRTGLTQQQAASRAGLSQSGWSRLEVDADAGYTLATWDRAAHAVGGSLEAFVRGGSAADRPRDVIHLKGQELILRTAASGGWRGLPEARLDHDAMRSRFADVLLQRHRHDWPSEYALLELIDWFDDVGTPTREWQRRLEAAERQAIARMSGDEPLPAVSGCWVVRATRRNRELVGQHRHYFHARFPGSGRAWLSALGDPRIPMPHEPALLLMAIGADRLFAARLG